MGAEDAAANGECDVEAGAGSIVLNALRGDWSDGDACSSVGEKIEKTVGRARAYFGAAALPSSELSHSIFATAISAVSLSESFSCVRKGFRTAREDGSDIAPIASAACVCVCVCVRRSSVLSSGVVAS